MVNVINIDELLNNWRKNRKKDVRELQMFSQYQKVFDESCMGWSMSREYNIMYLRQLERYANDMLIKNGYLFLNEVYQMLDLPKTMEGQIVGWAYDKENPNVDNFVQFEIFQNLEFNYIVVDFNVDGVILQYV